MLSPLKKMSGQNLARHMGSFVFFAGFYLYLWLVVDLRLIYHGGGTITNFPVFFRGWDFFRDFLSYPGGLVEYFSAFLSQLLFYPWLGTLVITLQAWLVCKCMSYVLETLNASRLRWISFIPPILLLALYGQYTYYFVTTMALLTALLFVCLYFRINAKKGLIKLAVFLLLSITLYYVAGAAYLFFATLCTIYELLFKRSWQMGLVCLLSTFAVPYVEGFLVIRVSTIDAFSELLPWSWKSFVLTDSPKMLKIVYIIYLLLPVAALGLGLWRVLSTGRTLSPNQPDSSRSKPEKATKKLSDKPWLGMFTRYARIPAVRWNIESAILLVTAVIVAYFSYNREIKAVIEIDYYNYHKMWPQAIAVADDQKSENFFITHLANRALYNTGRLGYDMFSYPQHPAALLLTATSPGRNYWKQFDIRFGLGFANEAEHTMAVCLEILGEQPAVLKNLALTAMVRSDIGSARVYLQALTKTLFDADWANGYLQRLEADPNLSTDQPIQQLRRSMMKKDYESGLSDIGDLLSVLLEENSRNKMAFEYMMAWYLLNRQLNKFVQNLSRLDGFDYVEIPSLYEEAILIHESRAGQKIDLGKHRISRKSRQRYKNFMQIYYTQNKETAVKELARNYGNSFMFYYTYGFSGIKK